MINLPAGEVRAADVPILTFPVGSQNKGAFACAYQNSNFAHRFLPLEFFAVAGGGT